MANLRGINMLVIDRVNKRYMINCKYLNESGILNMKNVHNACVRYQLRKEVRKMKDARKMNAKEMFEECDYIKVEDEKTIDFSRSEEDYIYFEKERKLIGIGIYKINVDTLKAINKQCEELGWTLN